MHQPGEPSVEEILDSIKKVIARDNRDGAIAERRRRTLEGMAREVAETEAVGEAGEILDLGDADIVATDDVDLHQAEIEQPPEGEEADALTRGDTREAMRQNFAALAMLSQPGKQPQIVRSGETSLEGLTRELLRPMLAQWLDENLPGMVEELVKAEIARIAGKRS